VNFIEYIAGVKKMFFQIFKRRVGDYLVSVIIPNYNNEKYLEECIQSVLNQTYKNIEVLIIDDASTDNSIEVIQKYIKLSPSIRLIRNSENLGVSKNRHKAIMKAKGKYITTLDSDDYYIDTEKIEKELDIILVNGEESIAFSNIVIVDNHGVKKFPNAKNNIKEGDIFEPVLTRSCMIPRDFLCTKKQYLAVGGFDKDIPIYEDWDLKIRLSKENKFCYSGVDGVAYRRHGTGLSSVKSSEHVKWLKYIFEKNDRLIPSSKRREVKELFDNFLFSTF